MFNIQFPFILIFLALVDDETYEKQVKLMKKFFFRNCWLRSRKESQVFAFDDRMKATTLVTCVVGLISVSPHAG
jgi:hypothetical protein